MAEARTQLAELVAEIDAALATLTDELGDYLNHRRRPRTLRQEMHCAAAVVRSTRARTGGAALDGMTVEDGCSVSALEVPEFGGVQGGAAEMAWSVLSGVIEQYFDQQLLDLGRNRHWLAVGKGDESYELIDPDVVTVRMAFLAPAGGDHDSTPQYAARFGLKSAAGGAPYSRDLYSAPHCCQIPNWNGFGSPVCLRPGLSFPC